jgi:hypothetical protein
MLYMFCCQINLSLSAVVRQLDPSCIFLLLVPVEVNYYQNLNW